MYTWNMPNTFPQSKACLYNQSNVDDYFSLQTGCELISVPACVYFDSKASHDFLSQYDYLPNNTGSLLLSSRLSDWLQQTVADCVQPIPAVIQCQDGPLQDYWVVNIVQQVAAINEAKSMAGSFGIYHKLVYLSETDNSLFLARCKGNLAEVLVSNALKQALQQTDFRILKFYACPIS